MEWENHTGINCVIKIEKYLDNIKKVVECNAVVKNRTDLLEVGNEFQIDGGKLELVKANFSQANKGVYYQSTSEKGVYYQFTSEKGAF